MSDLFSPKSPSATDADTDEEALLFARCSPASSGEGGTAAPKEPKGKKTAAPDDDLALHREHPSNVRHSHLTYRHLVISLSTSLVIGLLVLYVGRAFYLDKIEPRLAGGVVPAAPASTDSALKAELAASAEHIAALQKLVDVMRREQLLMQQNTRESLENISKTLKNPQLAPSPVTVTADQPGAARLADLKPDVSPTQEEFIRLKERNILTQYADEAIATGERRPLELLVEYMRNPQAEHLHAAAQAEFMRALRSIQILQREEPGYRLPVTELFKDGSIRAEADIKPEVLLKLLADYKQPWEVRVRVCFLLLGSPLPETNAQLIKAIKEDPSLDVAKHAQLALEQRVKTRFRFLDIPSIEEWFKKQGK